MGPISNLSERNTKPMALASLYEPKYGKAIPKLIKINQKFIILELFLKKIS